MQQTEIRYQSVLENKQDISDFYEEIGWNAFLKLSPEAIQRAMACSWATLYAYEGSRLIGCGRVLCDGVMTAFLCGLGVLPAWRNQGVAGKIITILNHICLEKGIYLQLVCHPDLEDFYQKKGFFPFATGMKFKTVE